DLLVVLEGEACVGDGGLATLRGVLTLSVKLGIDLSIHTADEERSDGGEARQVVAVVASPLEAGEERLYHLAVALEGEDERDVDGDSEGQGLGDGGQALGSRGDLDHRVRAVHEP